MSDLPDWPELADDFIDVFFEFDNEHYSKALIIRALKGTKYFFGSRWGEYKDGSNFQLGWFNYAAHSIFVTMKKISMTKDGVAPAAVRSVNTSSIADESVVYGSQIMMGLTPWTEELASTAYGIEYMARRANVKMIGAMV